MSWLRDIFSQLLGKQTRQLDESDDAGVTVHREVPSVTCSDPDDPMYSAAVEFASNSHGISISKLQRHLKIGYSRAARLIEVMELEGVVSAVQDDGSRRLLSKVDRLAHFPDNQTNQTTSDDRGVEPLRRQSGPKPKTVSLPSLTGTIRGTKSCGFDIVGESYYQRELRAIRNSNCLAEYNDFEAYIVTEPDNPHDPNACAVYIEGYKVGYLARADAASYVKQLISQGVLGISCFKLRGKLVGGFGARPNIGVLLNLPKDQ